MIVGPGAVDPMATETLQPQPQPQPQPRHAAPFAPTAAPFAPIAAPGPTAAEPGVPARRFSTAGRVLLAVLLLVVAVEGILLGVLNGRVARAERATAAARADADSRLSGLESRTASLEGRLLDTQAITTAVLPSVFAVEDGSGGAATAFAFGKADSGGGTNLVTNFHVVAAVVKAGGNQLSIVQNDKRFTAKIVKTDPAHDLALLHTDEKFSRLSAATVPAVAGEPVVVVGNSLGVFENTVTSGVISGIRTGIPVQGSQYSGPFLQYDAVSFPGNSGGPVLNGRHEVVGVNDAGLGEGGRGIGLAIPVPVLCASFDVC